MVALVLRRLFWMVPTLLVISLVSFAIIQLPPGDYLSAYIAALAETGEVVDQARIEALRAQYALDRPFIVQYGKWLWGLLPVGFDSDDAGKVLWWRPTLKRPDMGTSLEWGRPVAELIGERILLTSLISVAALVLTWALAIPIGVFSAVRQYSLADYFFTFVGFVGLATPPFMLALVLMYLSYALFGESPGGLFSPEFQNAPWSWPKVLDLLAHAWVPVVIVGTQGTAGMIRVMRGNLLDELRKQYVLTARAKGVPRVRLLLKYPVRVAINPMISTVGYLLPGIISGATIVSVVLGLPTTGPMLLGALMNQDMYLAGSFVMLLASLTVIGTLISDLLLLALDPRIRFEKQMR